MPLEENTGVSVKHEPLDENDAGCQTFPDPRKRRSLNQESPEKRQKLDDDGLLVTPGFAARFVRTAMSMSEISEDSSTNHGDEQDTAIETTESNVEYDPYYNMRVLSLPILESLSAQILSTFIEGSYSAVVSGIADHNSNFYQAHATLVSLFDQAKKIYSTDTTFLSAEQLGIKDPKDKELIHSTNVATYVAAVFGGTLGLSDLDDNFLDTFAPEEIPLEDACGDLFLNLKTQMYLSSVSQEEQEDTKEDLLERFFSPTEIRQRLAARHLLSPLTAPEERFVKECEHRIQHLMDSANDIITIQQLMADFPWEGFLTKLRDFISKKPLLHPFALRHTSPRPSPPPQMPQKVHSAEDEAALVADDFTEQLISAAAQRALDSIGVKSQNEGALENQQTHQQSNEYTKYVDAKIFKPEPIKALYNKARQAVVAKPSPVIPRSRPGMPSQRRPWNTSEENALMTGLDQVKGPHWSQILGLYGANGSINTVLRDRNQVQLKDKARNIKLFFLKSGFEVPPYLQHVTGELKTRAPTQAARKEAELRMRLTSDDERARIEGIGILAGGLHHQNRAGSQGSSQSQSMSSVDDAIQDQFHVAEPEDTEPSMPALETEHDEQLRQALLGAAYTVLSSNS